MQMQTEGGVLFRGPFCIFSYKHSTCSHFVTIENACLNSHIVKSHSSATSLDDFT